MTLANGVRVRNTKKPEWGIGTIVELEDHKVRVLFRQSGIRTLDLSYAKLEEVGDSAVDDPEPTSVPVNVERVRELCLLFVREMEGNRKTYNDAGVAERILEELERQGSLTYTTAKRLAAWCNTEGAVYQAGVPLAREISLAAFGRVLNKYEFD